MLNDKFRKLEMETMSTWKLFLAPGLLHQDEYQGAYVNRKINPVGTYKEMKTPHLYIFTAINIFELSWGRVWWGMVYASGRGEGSDFKMHNSLDFSTTAIRWAL